jgi:hypothetical protein
LHDHIYLTRRHHAKSFYTFILAINFNRMGCPTYGTSLAAFSLFQGIGA